MHLDASLGVKKEASNDCHFTSLTPELQAESIYLLFADILRGGTVRLMGAFLVACNRIRQGTQFWELEGTIVRFGVRNNSGDSGKLPELHGALKGALLDSSALSAPKFTSLCLQLWSENGA